MKRLILTSLEKETDLLERIGLSKSTLNNKVNEGLWTPPVSLGARAVGFLQHESDELLTAHVGGYTTDEIRGLVKRLIKERNGSTES